MSVPYILVPILMGLIGGILGFILGKINSKKDNSLETALQADLDACKANIKNLNAKILSLEADLFEKSHASTSNSFVSAEPVLIFDEELANTVFNKKIKENDLRIVEGIGPTIEFVLNAAGITTWKVLSETSTEELQAILDADGENYAMHNPSTWAKQALLAYEGKWQDLKDLHENLLGGKE